MVITGQVGDTVQFGDLEFTILAIDGDEVRLGTNAAKRNVTLVPAEEAVPARKPGRLSERMPG